MVKDSSRQDNDCMYSIIYFVVWENKEQSFWEHIKVNEEITMYILNVARKIKMGKVIDGKDIHGTSGAPI